MPYSEERVILIPPLLLLAICLAIVAVRYSPSCKNAILELVAPVVVEHHDTLTVLPPLKPIAPRACDPIFENHIEEIVYVVSYRKIAGSKETQEGFAYTFGTTFQFCNLSPGFYEVSIRAMNRECLMSGAMKDSLMIYGKTGKPPIIPMQPPTIPPNPKTKRLLET